MLELPNITLFAIDCYHPEKTLRAIRHTLNLVKFGEVILITDKQRRLANIEAEGIPKCVQIIHHEQSDEKVSPAGIPNLLLPKDYERDVLRLPAEYLRTKHLLHLEWDSAVLNPLAWTDDFLEYDYIGAPWPDHDDPGWPACNSTNNVGNGGFALKSAKFCKLIRRATDEFAGDPGMISSDRWQCRTMRPWLEKHGVKFAPEVVASMFSCEGRIYSSQFGFHGGVTAKMNNWSGEFFDPIKDKK